jgi:uncharacterized protein (TIGR02186 family)
MTRLPLAVIATLIATLSPVAARADNIIADLSSHMIGITTGFTGASVVLFGATDGPADVIAVIRGPEHDETVWRKGKVAGIWTNAESVTFANVPSFYGIAASRPLEDIVSPAAAALHRIGVTNLKFEPRGNVVPERAQIFTDALIAVQKAAGAFSPSHVKIYFLGDRLFRTTFTFPANLATGTYLVEVFLVRDKDVVSGQTTPLIVSRVGVDAEVFDFAQRRSLTYGAIAVVMAVMAGWLASLPFRNA